jgi:hypothetical protein
MPDLTQHLPSLAERYVQALVARDTSLIERMNPHAITHHPVDGLTIGTAALTARFAAGPSWLPAEGGTVESFATTHDGRCAVAESIVHTTVDNRDVALPIAAVVELDGHGLIAQVRLYHSTRPLTGDHRHREPLRQTWRDLPLTGAVDAFHTALAAGDAKDLVATFTGEGYTVDAEGGRHEGEAALTDLWSGVLERDGSPALERCAVTDDGTSSALEFTLVRRGTERVPAQPGLVIHERGDDEHLTAVRFYELDLGR